MKGLNLRKTTSNIYIYIYSFHYSFLAFQKNKNKPSRASSLTPPGDQAFVPELINLSEQNRVQSTLHTLLFENGTRISLQPIKKCGARKHFLRVQALPCMSLILHHKTRPACLVCFPPRAPALPARRYLGWKHHKGILEKSFFNYKFNENISYVLSFAKHT